MVLVFGENGSGKSTIIDALEFVGGESLGSLADRSVGTSKAKYATALGQTSKDVEVTLEHGGQQWVAKLGRTGPQVSGPDGRPIIHVLRRSQTLRIVDSEPKGRYDALKSFIAVPGVEAGEVALRKAADQAGKEYTEAVRARQQAQDALERLWVAEHKPGTSSLAWAKERAKESEAGLAEEYKHCRSLVEAIERCDTQAGLLAEAESDVAKALGSLSQAEAACSEAEHGPQKNAGAMLTLLQDTLAFLKQSKDTKTCPVCERPVDSRQLSERISKRLEEMERLTKLRKAADGAKAEHERRLAGANQRASDFVADVRKLAQTAKASALKEVMDLSIPWERFESQTAKVAPPMSDEMLASARDLFPRLKPLATPVGHRRDAAIAAKEKLNAIKTSLDTLKEKSSESVHLESLAKRLAAMRDVVEHQRKSYVEDVLEGITGSVEGLYTKVHPEEGIGGVRFFLKPNVLGSVEFEGKFQSEKDVPPQAYYSESHLDTLGICVFLALAKYFNDGNTVVVLDDVLTSVDQVHMERFMRMLHSVAGEFAQVIVATHYRPWRDAYRFARGPAANVQLIELLHWSLPRGIRHTRTKLCVDDLRECVDAEPLKRQEAASQAGILLESLLDHIALLFRCRLPRQAEPEYTLGDLSSAIDTKLAKLLVVEKSHNGKSTRTELLPLLTASTAHTWVRNQVGCHFSATGNSSDADVEAFARAVTDLASAMVCDGCGELPRRNRTGSHWECSCGKTILHPLAPPGGIIPPVAEV
jgi:hypothetical protein